MHTVTIESARLIFEKFEKFSNDSIGREALAEGLEELLEVKDSTSDTKAISVCDSLIDTYRKKVQEEVLCLLDKDSFLSQQLLQHWYETMAEFQSLEIVVPEEFLQLMRQLKTQILVKEIKQWSSEEKQKLLKLLESS